eukprot:1028438-Alexandrium_andersonii.AAC.1
MPRPRFTPRLIVCFARAGPDPAEEGEQRDGAVAPSWLGEQCNKHVHELRRPQTSLLDHPKQQSKLIEST